MKRNPEDIRRAARIFKALSHPSRLEIACRLAEASSSQKDLIEAMGIPQSSVARMLAPLRDLGLVQGERQGQEVQLSVGSPIIRLLVESVCEWLHPSGNSHAGPHHPKPTMEERP